MDPFRIFFVTCAFVNKHFHVFFLFSDLKKNTPIDVCMQDRFSKVENSFVHIEGIENTLTPSLPL
jgi:hypothetical protein